MMDEELSEAIQRNLQLSGELMEQAAKLKENVDILESKNEMLDKERKLLLSVHAHNCELMQQRLLSQWALRVRYAHSMVLLFSSLLREERNSRHPECAPLYTKDGGSPFNSKYKKQELLSAGSWVLIWNEVEKRVKKRYQMFCDSIKKQKEAKNGKV
jgi:vacuolar-type H+-ATPase subunit H